MSLLISLYSCRTLFAPSCISHTVLSRRDWFTIKIGSVTLPQALQCWISTSPEELNMRSKITSHPSTLASNKKTEEFIIRPIDNVRKSPESYQGSIFSINVEAVDTQKRQSRRRKRKRHSRRKCRTKRRRNRKRNNSSLDDGQNSSLQESINSHDKTTDEMLADSPNALAIIDMAPVAQLAPQSSSEREIGMQVGNPWTQSRDKKRKKKQNDRKRKQRKRERRRRNRKRRKMLRDRKMGRKGKLLCKIYFFFTT